MPARLVLSDHEVFALGCAIAQQRDELDGFRELPVEMLPEVFRDERVLLRIIASLDAVYRRLPGRSHCVRPASLRAPLVQWSKGSSGRAN